MRKQIGKQPSLKLKSVFFKLIHTKSGRNVLVRPEAPSWKDFFAQLRVC